MTSGIRPFVKVLLASEVLKQKDIAEATHYGRSTISMWLNGGYNRDATNIEAAVRKFIAPYLEEDQPALGRLSARDQRRLTDLLSILDDADDRSNLIAALARFGRHECATA